MKYLLASTAIFATRFALAADQPIYAQCGGIGWTGGTTCVSGTTCQVLNPYYYQCLPAPSTSSARASSTSVSSSSSSVKPSSSTSASVPSGTSLPFLGGVNLAGFDFGVQTDGSQSGTGVDPPLDQIPHFAAQGVNLFRVPFAWQLATPTIGGTLDATFFARFDKVVQAALAASTNPWVILDLHNYARVNGQIVNDGGPTNEQYASLWGQIAAKYKDNSKIIFGIMNEPHDLRDLSLWKPAVQAAVNAIRAAGATSQYILIPGSSWSSAEAFPTEGGPLLLSVTDPAGGVSKLIFDVHKYLDSDNSGTHAECVKDNVDIFTTLKNYLQANGNRQAIVSETGGGNTDSCNTYFKAELAYIKANSNTLVGYAVWSAGAFSTDYVLSVVPRSDGSDSSLWVNAVRPNLP